jgi:hypothetical protein
MYAIFDGRGRRMVMPRHSRDEAIARIAGAIVGSAASAAEKSNAWERLCGQGYRFAWVGAPRLVRAVHGNAATAG